MTPYLASTILLSVIVRRAAGGVKSHAVGSPTTTYQQDRYLEPIIPLVGEDNIIWGADYPHPDCIWPASRQHIEANLGSLAERVQRKITSENVIKLYNLG